MPTVIRKADGKEFAVNDGHYAMTDERFTVKVITKPKRKPRKAKPKAED